MTTETTLEVRRDPDAPEAVVVLEDGRGVVYFHEGDRGWTWESGRFGPGSNYSSRNQAMAQARKAMLEMGRDDIAEAIFDYMHPGVSR